MAVKLMHRRHEEKDLGESWENLRPRFLHKQHSEIMVMEPYDSKAPITFLWAGARLLLRVQHSKEWGVYAHTCAFVHTHTHTHARCYQGKGRIMGTEDGDSHLETILTNIDQHYQQIRLVFNIGSLQLWAFSLAWHLFNLIDPLTKTGEKWESEDVPPHPHSGPGHFPISTLPSRYNKYRKMYQFPVKDDELMNWTQALLSALFKNSMKATKGDLATTNKAQIKKDQ